MNIVIGIGNYGKQYEHTNHNMGFDVVDALAKRLKLKFDKEAYKGLIARGEVDGEELLIVKPQTYVNRSGECVELLQKKYPNARILVVVDDFDLPRGYVRYRERGSGGTHNGLRNIVEHIGQEFERIKIGIGRDISVDVIDFVLSKYDKEFFAPVIEKAVDEVLNRL